MSSSPTLRTVPVSVLFCTISFGLFGQSPPSPNPLAPGDSTYFQQFGWAVAADGDTVVVGAPVDSPGGVYNAGAAYVFVRDGNTWIEQAKLAANDAVEFSQFGGAIALEGDTAAVGARYDSANAGAVYVFARQGNQWMQQAKLTPRDAASGQEFGGAVALDGDLVAVGAMADAQGGYNAGAAYVFARTGQGWAEQAKVMSDVPHPGDLFGFAIAIDGETVVVGAPFEDDVAMDAGAAYVFTRTVSGWTERTKLLARDGATSDLFGWSVAIAGNRSLIGAPQKSGTAEFAGVGYTFTRDGVAWTPEARLEAIPAGASDYLGYSVALRGDWAAIGAPLDSSRAQVSGTARLFQWDGNAWTQDCQLDGGSALPGDEFGSSVALANSWLVVGAPFNDQGVGFDNGAAYAFALPSPNAPPVADASATLSEVTSMNRVDAAVTLDGSRSQDPDHDPLTFAWSLGGTVMATGSPAVVILPLGIHELTLTVSDGSLTASTTFAVSVIPVNHAPVADASATPQEVTSMNHVDAAVTLDGSRSQDPDHDPLTFAWSLGGTVMATGSPAVVTLPIGTHELNLTVSDGSLQAATTLVVTVVDSFNAPPVADAGATVREVISPDNRSARLTLDGSRSFDPEGKPLTYQWAEGRNALGSGPVVRVSLPVGQHEVVLTVSDGQAGDQDLVTVRVITPAAATRSLIRMVEAADVPRARERSMLAILRAAERSFQRGQVNAAVHQLQAFQRLVLAHEGRKIDPITAARLVWAAQRIVDVVPRR
jgi:hypothetical protein